MLSVHFLPGKEGWRCVDYSAEDFKDGLLDIYGSIEAVHEAYWLTVQQAIEADLGPFKPRRIGHLSLVHKFQKKFPLPNPKQFQPKVCEILDQIQAKGMELDLNAAGLFKPDCQEIYPPAWILRQAIQRKIPLVYGSDAHSVQGVGQGFEVAERLVQSLMSNPSSFMIVRPALVTRADLPQIVIGIDSGGMAIIPGKLNGVMTDGSCRRSAG